MSRDFCAHGIQVEQRLTGVFVGAVAAIDHWHAAGFGKLRNAAGFRVAHDDDIAVARKHPGGIVKGLALGERRRLGLGGFTDFAAK